MKYHSPDAVPVRGFVVPGLEPVRDAFVENFLSHGEIGAGVAVYRGDEPLADLYGGCTGPNRSTAMTGHTLLPVYSVTKGVAALVLARVLHDSGGVDYDTPVADVWPDFAAEGKQNITIGQLVSHQAGLVGFPYEISRDVWADTRACASALAACPPLWPTGTGSGYHPVSWGYLVGEIVLRLTGDTLGTHLRAFFTANPDIGEVIDFHIGLPESEHARCGRMRRPPGLPDFPTVNQERHIAFIAPWNRHTMSERYWRSIEIPSTNGHGTARAMARLWGVYASRGSLNGCQILPEASMNALTEVRVAGEDRVLTFPVAFAAGAMVNRFRLFGPETTALAHPGWGGALGLADPVRGISFGYVPNRQSALLGCDPRAERLITALYACI